MFWFQEDLTALNAANQPQYKPVPLDNFTAVVTIAKVKSPTLANQLLRLTTNSGGGLNVIGAEGQLDIVITDTQIDAIGPGNFYWDGLVIGADSTVYVWPQHGRFKIQQNISRSVAPT